MRLLLAAAASVALSACASQESTLTSATAPVVVTTASSDLTPQTKLVCHKESSLGSQMLHNVCEAPRSEADRAATQEGLRQMAPPNAVTVRAPG